MATKRKAGVLDYVKSAFYFRWNLLFFLGATGVAALSGAPDVMLPLVAAAELTYLAAMTSTPKFRQAIDARVHHEQSGARGKAATGEPAVASRKLGDVLGGLEPRARGRFQRLRERCLEMRRIADGVRGKTSGNEYGDELRTPALDRLLWVFLRLLFSQQALQRFLDATDADEIKAKIAELEARIAKAGEGGNERVMRSLADNLATNQLRLDNYQKAESNAEFVTIELDRIEGKIQALVEMSVSHQDPDYISSQVDSVASSMAQTEQAIAELNHITGLTDEMEGPPPIMETDLATVLQR